MLTIGSFRKYVGTVFISKMYNEFTVEICTVLGFNSIFKGYAVCFALKYVADMLFRNVGTE